MPLDIATPPLLGEVAAQGRVVSAGRKAAFAEGKIFDAAGKLYATGSTT